MSRVEFPGEISARRLQDSVRPPQFPGFPLQLGDLFLSSLVVPGRCPESISAPRVPVMP
jgi:hypothetical protein